MATSGHDGNLKIADLKDVKSALWDARAKWRDIGSCIGVDEGTLDTMKGKDPGESLREVLSHWLRGVYNPKEKNSKPRTWHTLIEALRDKIVNEEAMANKLSESGEKPGDPDTNQGHRRDPPDESSATNNLMFSSSMSDEDFFKWLRSKGISDKDCKALSDNGITPSGFPLCDVEDFDDIGLTKIGKKLVLRNFTEVKGQRHEGSRDQHPRQAEGRDQHTVNDGRPTIEELVLLKYTDKGMKTKLQIINKASHKWKDIASLICGDANVTTRLEDKYRGDPNECLRQTFISYFIDKKPQRYTQDWNGLIELLDDIDLETLAESVKFALDNKI